MSLNPSQYSAFASQLGQMLDLLQHQQSNNQLDVADIDRSLASLQNFFQTNIIPLCELDHDTDGREQMYRTEMSKQMRLLEIDVTFLRNARHSQTQQTRLKAINTRLTTLVSYCQAASSL
ncbi:heterocyst frequency control protein PatD [Calothrix sp. NIES-3974]|uniref:heterocyst frequency control protein PatD n=1 Tax=Calothrix sp. NIES-3974 TaxID=2005462 RepID=UPI000B5E1653|nr:heterocyst frequency control protein PatD [Calothrix sp. NIES-3974]BAZ06955.1 hypothetical protein NIES3974_36170 [Calothrix sp. NIES-3974]